MKKSPPSPPPDDDIHDSWRPADKGEEALVENPGEFEPRSATESAQGPVLDEEELPLKADGDATALERIEK